jgi:putative transposase
MSRKGNCWDNTVEESFFSSLKKERVKKHIYKTRELAIADVSDYIESLCNPVRRHTYLGGISPISLRLLTNPGDGVSTESWELQGRCASSQRTPTQARRVNGRRHHPSWLFK